MTKITTSNTELFHNYQNIYRLPVVAAGILTLWATSPTKILDDWLLMGSIIALLCYGIVGHIISTVISKEKRQRITKPLIITDALVTGAIIVLIKFNIFAAALFMLMFELNTLINRGAGKLLIENIALLLGCAILFLLLEPDPILQPEFISVAPIFVALAIYLTVYAIKVFKQSGFMRHRISELEKEKLQLKLRNYQVSKYLSPSLRTAILSGKDVKLETRRKRLTVFFSDIQGFSDLAEEMEGDALTSLLNNYLTEMSKIALKHGGTIDKFIGDAIMVFFGDPTTKGVKEDCVAAVSMAIDMKKQMKELQRTWLNQGIQKPLEIRMGINTGFCAVGNFGTENRLDYTLLGTEVNLASRLESAATPGDIYISHETYSLVKDIIMCQDRGEVQLKGYKQPVQAYSVVDFRKNLGKDQTYFEHMTDGFSVFMDMDRVRSYDRDKILQALDDVTERIKNQSIY